MNVPIEAVEKQEHSICDDICNDVGRPGPVKLWWRESRFQTRLTSPMKLVSRCWLNPPMVSVDQYVVAVSYDTKLTLGGQLDTNCFIDVDFRLVNDIVSVHGFQSLFKVQDIGGNPRYGVSGNQRSRNRDYLKSHLLVKRSDGDQVTNSGQRYTVDETGFQLVKVRFFIKIQSLLLF